MRWLYELTVWLHILAAMVWIGGAAFIALVLVPAVRAPGFAPVAPSILRAGAMRFRTVGWISLAILVLTGCAILGFRGFGWNDCLTGAVFRGDFGKALAIKLILVTAILSISGFHDFYLGPKAAGIILEDPGSAAASAARKRAALFGRFVLGIGLFAVLAAVMLVRGIP
ncbi:MAG: copper resistance [Fibrobacteres bacterium]|nr:copper resistance [Fibrobacterota bacterium]